MTPEQREEVIRLYLEETLSIATISARLHVGNQSAWEALHEVGVVRDRGQSPALAERIAAGRAHVSVEEYRRRTKRGEKHCSLCSTKDRQVWHHLGEMINDARSADGKGGWCKKGKREKEREYDSRQGCLEHRRPWCLVRWGKNPHRHCPEPLRVMEDGTVYPCDQPMVLDADRCATCESLLLLQKRIVQLEAELQMRTGRRLPSLVDDPRDPIPRGELSA